MLSLSKGHQLSEGCRSPRLSEGRGARRKEGRTCRLREGCRAVVEGRVDGAGPGISIKGRGAPPLPCPIHIDGSDARTMFRQDILHKTGLLRGRVQREGVPRGTLEEELDGFFGMGHVDVRPERRVPDRGAAPESTDVGESE